MGEKREFLKIVPNSRTRYHATKMKASTLFNYFSIFFSSAGVCGELPDPARGPCAPHPAPRQAPLARPAAATVAPRPIRQPVGRGLRKYPHKVVLFGRKTGREKEKQDDTYYFFGFNLVANYEML